MFGDKPMLGNCIRAVDHKGRIYLPKFCNAEKDDNLVIQRIDNHFALFNLSHIEEEIEKARNLKDLKKVDLIVSSIVDLVKVDKVNRINLKRKYISSDQVFLQGNLTNVLLFPTMEDYNQYVLRNK